MCHRVVDKDSSNSSPFKVRLPHGWKGNFSWNCKHTKVTRIDVFPDSNDHKNYHRWSHLAHAVKSKVANALYNQACGATSILIPKPPSFLGPNEFDHVALLGTIDY